MLGECGCVNETMRLWRWEGVSDDPITGNGDVNDEGQKDLDFFWSWPSFFVGPSFFAQHYELIIQAMAKYI